MNVWPSAREERRWCQRRAAGEVVVVSKKRRRWQGEQPSKRLSKLEAKRERHRDSETD